jgi:hypothetical protein
MVCSGAMLACLVGCSQAPSLSRPQGRASEPVLAPVSGATAQVGATARTLSSGGGDVAADAGALPTAADSAGGHVVAQLVRDVPVEWADFFRRSPASRLQLVVVARQEGERDGRVLRFLLRSVLPDRFQAPVLRNAVADLLGDAGCDAVGVWTCCSESVLDTAESAQWRDYALQHVVHQAIAADRVSATYEVLRQVVAGGDALAGTALVVWLRLVESAPSVREPSSAAVDPRELLVTAARQATDQASHPAVLVAALSILGRCGVAADMPSLAHCLGSPALRVRRAALAALVAHPHGATEAAALQRVSQSDPDAGLRQAAAAQVGAWKTQGVVFWSPP